MKKIAVFSVLFLSLIFISNSTGLPQDGNSIIQKIRLLPEDIPQGFMFGLIPDGAKNTLKDNPWQFDKTAIEKLSDKIYPGGDFNQIAGIHVTIFARMETPHRDDIVCYIIQYKNLKTAKDEIKKISEYAGFNQDRVILHVKENIVVFLFADDINNFRLLKELDKKIIERMGKS